MKNTQYEDLLFQQIQEAGTLLVPVRQYKALPERKFTWDFAWIEQQLLVEVQGGTWVPGQFGHTSGAGYRRDCFKNDLVTALGWRVLWFTSDMVTHKEALSFIKVFFGLEPIDEVMSQFMTRTKRNDRR